MGVDEQLKTQKLKQYNRTRSLDQKLCELKTNQYASQNFKAYEKSAAYVYETNASLLMADKLQADTTAFRLSNKAKKETIRQKPRSGASLKERKQQKKNEQATFKQQQEKGHALMDTYIKDMAGQVKLALGDSVDYSPLHQETLDSMMVSVSLNKTMKADTKNALFRSAHALSAQSAALTEKFMNIRMAQMKTGSAPLKDYLTKRFQALDKERNALDAQVNALANRLKKASITRLVSPKGQEMKQFNEERNAYIREKTAEFGMPPSLRDATEGVMVRRLTRKG